MWNVKKKVIPIIINKGNWNHLKIIQKIRKQHTGKARHQDTTKNSQFDTTCIFRKVLMYKYKTFIIINSIKCTTHSNHSTALNMFFAGICL
jgi:hypothetical protein